MAKISGSGTVRGGRDGGTARASGSGTARRAKRGVMFALSAMLLCIALLSFAFYLSQESAKAKQTVAGILEIDRASNTYSNAEAGLRDILSNAANFSVQCNGPQNCSLLISESLPISPQAAIGMERFAQFESGHSDLNITMNLTNLENASFIIQPGNTRITNAEGDFHIIPATPEGAQGILSYGINLTFPMERLGENAAVSWQAQNASGNASNITLRILVQNEGHSPANESDYSFAKNFLISIGRQSEGTLNITDQGEPIGYVRFTPDASVQVHYAGNMGLKASIEFSHPIYVEANDTITIISAVNKSGKIRIA